MRPKVMLHPRRADALRTRTELITANVAGCISWSRLVEALRESGDLRADEDVEAFVLDDDGINIYVKERR